MSQQTVNSTSDNFSKRQANQTCPWFAEDVSVKAVKILGYSLVLIISLLGNSITVATVARNKRMQTAINYLIANMAASDLLISTFAVPMQLSEIATGPRRWLMDGTVGLISCKLAYFFQDISTAVSIQSLVVIAVDRHRAIVFPFRPAIVTRKRCKFIIPLIWLSSMGLHAIYFYIWRIITHNDKSYCIASWAPHFHPQDAHELYVIMLLVFIVMLPFIQHNSTVFANYLEFKERRTQKGFIFVTIFTSTPQGKYQSDQIYLRYHGCLLVLYYSNLCLRNPVSFRMEVENAVRYGAVRICGTFLFILKRCHNAYDYLYIQRQISKSVERIFSESNTKKTVSDIKTDGLTDQI